MSLMDKIKAFFSGGSATEHDHAGHDHAGHDHSHEEGSSYLQSPTDPAEVPAPTPEEIAAATQAEPPTTTVEGLSEAEDSDEAR